LIFHKADDADSSVFSPYRTTNSSSSSSSSNSNNGDADVRLGSFSVYAYDLLDLRYCQPQGMISDDGSNELDTKGVDTETGQELVLMLVVLLLVSSSVPIVLARVLYERGDMKAVDIGSWMLV
jgi:hypothetical protein